LIDDEPPDDEQIAQRRARCAAANPSRSPPHRLLPPQVGAASQSPRPASMGAFPRTGVPAMSRSPTTAHRPVRRGRRLSCASRRRARRSTGPAAACR
jgi:hypothetical protein